MFKNKKICKELKADSVTLLKFILDFFKNILTA